MNKAIAAIGGTWDRRAGGHVFPRGVDPRQRVRGLLGGGVAVSARAAGFFGTPPDLADELTRLADIRDGDTVLKPSAARGAIADALLRCGRVDANHLQLIELLCRNTASFSATRATTRAKATSSTPTSPPSTASS